jgi:2-polyprenyl-3-methyl-5-hydroxy-6-metoxy-1,4-benzoquinol methylase
VKENYRDSLYRDYAVSIGGGTGSFDYAAADDWLPCLEYYLRDWLPEDPAGRIVDLGCGSGRIIYSLNKLGYQNVSGVDISESQLKLARQISSDVSNQNVVDYLKNKAGSFDLVLAFDLIEHLDKEDVLGFLQGCYACLNKGGRLVVQTPNAKSPFFGSVRYGDFTHEVAFTPNLLAQLMSRAGFSNISTREMPPVPIVYSFKSTLRFLGWQVIRALMGLVDLIETGSRGAAVYTRVFLISGVR